MEINQYYYDLSDHDLIIYYNEISSLSGIKDHIQAVEKEMESRDYSYLD